MHDQELSIVRALVPVAWADGDFADKEKEMLDALLDAYGATAAQRKALQEYAAQKRTLDDIELQDLSGGDRRTLLQQAVLLSFADGVQAASETTILAELADKLRIPLDESLAVIAEAETRAKKHLALLR